MAVRIRCVNKPSGNIQDPHEAISEFGWIDDATGVVKYSTRQQMVDFLKNGGAAYVEDNVGNRAFCNVKTSVNGTEFLQTVTDGKWSDNLLSLPKCTN